MKYEYKNLKTNKKIQLNIEKNFTFIYGPNGTGKTTFSREIGNGKIIKDEDINKIHLVFNQDFINNNIYITTSDGNYKTDSKNRSKLKQIFLGDSSKDDNEKLNFIRQKQREYSKLVFNINNFKNEFKNIAVNLIKSHEDYTQEYEKFIMEYVNDELLNMYFKTILKKVNTNKVVIDSLKIDDDEYIKNIDLGEINNTYNDEQVINELLEFCRECYNNKEKSLNKIIDKFNQTFINSFKIEFLSEKIEIISQLLSDLKLSEELYEIALKLDNEENEYLQEVLFRKNVDIKKVKQWIMEGNCIHKEIDFKNCLYCRSMIDENVKEMKNNLIKNKYLNYLEQYKKAVDEIIKMIDSLESEYNRLVSQQTYEITKRNKEEQYFRIIIKKKNIFKEKLKKILDEKKYNINVIGELKKFINIIKKANVYLKKVIKDEKVEKNKLVKAYQLYILSEKFIYELKVKLIQQQLVKDENKYKEKIKSDTKNYISKIKDYLKEFENIYEPRFELTINSNLTKADNAETTIEITSNETNFLNNISEGEKNILALIIFFSYVKNTLNSLNENEQIVLVLDDPVNSNDWGNFFKFQAIIEDYFYKDVFKYKKISNIIILSHNIDYAVIQLENDKYTKNFEFIRLFSDKAIKIDTKFIFMDDIKLGSKLIHDLYINIDINENKCFVNKHKLYRTAIYMRKFLEGFLNRTIAISNPDLIANEGESIKFIKNNINSENIEELLNISTIILKDTQKGIYSADQYIKKLTLALDDIINNSNLFLEDSQLKKLIKKYKDSRYIFFIKDEEEQYIIGSAFEIQVNEKCYDEELIDIMIKGLVTNINENSNSEKIEYVKVKAKNNYLKYMRHINDNVGRPVLAVNSDNIIESEGED